MPLAWRITKRRLQSSAFDGEGARLYGGRWNSPGNRMIYTASSQSLAVLEIMVHVSRPDLLRKYVAFAIEFPSKFARTLDQKRLPKNWAASPAPPELQAIGDEWLTKSDSAILTVPSAVIRDESNYLINPAHPDFSTLFIKEPKKFEFDDRLIKR